MRRVGIIGGMGPEATVLVMQKVIAAISAKDDFDHIPLIVDQNPQVPSRIEHLIDGIGEDPGPVLAGMARRLVAAGSEALAMPCNTAHHYASAIRAAVRVPFLDMVALSAARSAELARGAGPVGLLASPAVRKIGLFDAEFEKHGLTTLYPTNETALLTTIRQIKAYGPTPDARATLLAASQEMRSRGAVVQMVACTEFSLIADEVTNNATIFDTLDQLVLAIVGFSTNGSGGTA